MNIETIVQFVDDTPTIGLVVAAVVSQLVTDQPGQPRGSSWVKTSSVLVLAAYFYHQCVAFDAALYGGYIEIGIRSLSLMGIYWPFVMLLDGILQTVQSYWRSRCRATSSWLSQWRENSDKRRQRSEEERARREAQKNTEELPSDEEAFEHAMQGAQERFGRQCEIISRNPHLEPYERQAAIEQAKAIMTKRINQIMQGDYS